MEKTNYGFIAPYIQPEEWVLGGLIELPEESVILSGQWDAFLPLYEPQAEKYETYGCTVWGSENATEIYMKGKFGFEPNFDEAFIYNLVGIIPPGANPQDVYEVIRNYGLIANNPLPNTYGEFCIPRPPSIEKVNEGKKWLQHYTFKHQWLFYPTADLQYKQQKIKDCLPMCPIGVSVCAWKQRNNLYYKEIGEQDNHWCVVFGYVEGEYWKVFDSYDHSVKHLEWDYDFGFAKRIWIGEKKTVETKRSFIEIIIAFILSWLR